MTQREQARLKVLDQVLLGQIAAREAAQVLGLSQCHLWRMLAAYRKEGAASLAHGSRGRQPANTTPEETRRQVRV